MGEATPCGLFNGNRKGRIGKGCNLNFAAITQKKSCGFLLLPVREEWREAAGENYGCSTQLF